MTEVPCGVRQLRIAPMPGKRLEHQGIKVQLIGQIELLAERGQIGKAHSHDFVSLGEAPLPSSPLSTHTCAAASTKPELCARECIHAARSYYSRCQPMHDPALPSALCPEGTLPQDQPRALQPCQQGPRPHGIQVLGFRS